MKIQIILACETVYNYFIPFCATVNIAWGHPQHLRGNKFDCYTERYEIAVLLPNSEYTATSSQPKHKLWILKRILSMRRFFEALKHMQKLMGKKIKYLHFYPQKFCLSKPMDIQVWKCRLLLLAIFCKCRLIPKMFGSRFLTVFNRESMINWKPALRKLVNRNCLHHVTVQLITASRGCATLKNVRMCNSQSKLVATHNSINSQNCLITLYIVCWVIILHEYENC